MVKPVKTLLFLGLVFAYAALVMWFMPEKGIDLGVYTLRFPSWNSFWHRGEEQGKVAMDSYFDIYGRKKENATELSEEEKLALLEKMRQFQVPGDRWELFVPFFETLKKIPAGKRVRIIHFGDSQIEGNRITGPVHHHFQRVYGGKGPGWLPVSESIPTNAVRQKQSDNWSKFSVYGKKNSAYHKRYGLLGAFSRFTPEMAPIENTVLENSGQTQEIRQAVTPFSQETKVQKEKVRAWVELSPAQRGPAALKNYSQARLCFGNLTDTLWYKVRIADSVLYEGSWLPQQDLKTVTWPLPAKNGPLRMEFEGTQSPDFYGISLESAQGVYVDNIAMRGSSGTIFNQMDLGLLKKQVGEDHVAMIMLQYGGNSVPYIKSQKQVDDYQKWFSAQIRSLKKLFPDALILVIGPSDMSYKVMDKYETYPFLPQVRDALKNAAFSQGAMFFDLFEAMGGLNSMPGWVKSDPPLASPDHVHFAPAGSALVSEWLIEAFRKAETKPKNPVK